MKQALVVAGAAIVLVASFGIGCAQDAAFALKPSKASIGVYLLNAASGASKHDNGVVANGSGALLVAQATPLVAQATPPAAAPVTPPASAEPAYKRKSSPAGAKVYLAYPTNGATVPQNVKIRFGLIGMGVAPAGFDKANTGHHHLLIDTPLPPLDEPVPNDFHHLHFPLGQTEAEVTLPLGTHTLQLLFADTNHVPHDPAVFSEPIKVTVTVDGKKPKKKPRHSHKK